MITEFDLEKAWQVAERIRYSIEATRGDVSTDDGIIIVMSVAATMAEFLQVHEDEALVELFEFTKRKGN